MTVGAGEAFSGAVIGVAEGVAIGARAGARGPVRFLIVTDTARRDFAARGGFGRGCVTRVATVMGSDVCGD